MGALTSAQRILAVASVGVLLIAGCSGAGSSAGGSRSGRTDATTDRAKDSARTGSTRLDFRVPSTAARPTTTLAMFKVAAATTPKGFILVDRPADGYSLAIPPTWVVVGTPADLDELLALPAAKKAPAQIEAFRSLLSVRNAVVVIDRAALADRVGPLMSIASQPAAPSDPAQLDSQLLDRAAFEGWTSPELVALDIGGVTGRRLTYKQTTPTGVRSTQQYVLLTEEHLVSMSLSTDDLVRDASVFDQIVASFAAA